MQTIIGAGGAIGIPLAGKLKKYTQRIRLVSRNPKKVNADDELYKADVNVPGEIEKAIAGSEVVYVTIGFEYNLKVWERTWLPFMREVIESCKKHGSKLVFFDNMYLYSKNSLSFMTENSPVDPPSQKGKVRAMLNHMILEETQKGDLTALIARSADFYGPDNRNSSMNIMMVQNLIKGKKAQVFGDMNKIHTYTFTPDAAKATAILGNTPDAYNQVWHVPTTKDKLTTLDWIKLIAAEIGTEPRVTVIPAWMLHVLGLFIPMMREFPEMLYQNEQDYIFDSTKFEKRFGFGATDPRTGIKAMIKSIQSIR
jgi:nucleoside-diphosphate-sugar epimerase